MSDSMRFIRQPDGTYYTPRFHIMKQRDMNNKLAWAAWHRTDAEGWKRVGFYRTLRDAKEALKVFAC